MNNVKEEGKTFNRAIVIISVFSLIIAGILIFISLYAYHDVFGANLPTKRDEFGTFGDFIGGTLNPAFGLMSLLAILFTLIIQSRELSLSTSALKDQSKQLSLQAFENTYFSMLRLYIDSIDDVDISEEEEDRGLSKGVKAISILYKRYHVIYQRYKVRDMIDKEDEDVVKAAFLNFHANTKKHTGNFLRLQNEIVKFIENRCANNKKDYYSMLRSQMSEDEILIMVYSLISNDEEILLSKLIKNDFFENFPFLNLLDQELHKGYISGTNS